jgi:hypothetical protein
MLVLAALHYHALRADHDLAPLYTDMAALTPDAFAHAVTAVLERRPSLVRGELHRSTQTNEPGRSAVLATILGELSGRGVSDVHLIDVGTSMGLNLYPDYYRVNEDDTEGVVLTMEYLGEHQTSSPLPRIHQRIGIDLNPLDPENADDVLWLKACLWPEQPERIARFDEVLDEMVLWPKATRLRGSAVDLIDEALELCGPEAMPVIFHSWAAAYFSPEDQVHWRERIMSHVRTRALWVYFEHPWCVKSLEPRRLAARGSLPDRGVRTGRRPRPLGLGPFPRTLDFLLATARASALTRKVLACSSPHPRASSPPSTDQKRPNSRRGSTTTARRYS